ncbi:MAG TPA: glycosyltransferase family 4 protein [Polyangiales bacterium]|nr:glycosyltransferase family 4 protein [Polyangiales bacterium]
MADVLMVSKALAPPWNDSGKNLVRDLARGMTRHRPTLMVGDVDPGVPQARLAHVYRGGVGFAPALSDQARVFAHLLTARGASLWHFFFAPNPRSCAAGGLAKRLRRKRTLHTISSAPREPRALVPLLFADRNVVLSRHTERRFLEAGLAPERLARIAPAIEPLAPRQVARASLGLPASAPLVVYPGDLEFGEGAHLMIEAARALPDVLFVMACRTKTASAREEERTLQRRIAAHGLGARFRFVGETARIHDLLATADVVALPSRDLYAKMDYPLVLLEAMSLERAVIVATDSAAAELTEGDAACAVDVKGEALAATLQRLLADDEARAQLGSAARARVLAQYSYTTMAAAYEALYDGLV